MLSVLHVLNTAFRIIVLSLSDVVDFPLRSGSLFLSPKESDTDANSGFSGFVSKFRFYARSVPPREAYELYRQGFSDSWGGSAMSKFNLKFAFLKDDAEVAALQI